MFCNQEALRDEKQEAESIAALLGVQINRQASPVFWELPLLREIAERLSRCGNVESSASVIDLRGDLITAGNPYEADLMIVSFLGGVLARVERLEEELRRFKTNQGETFDGS